MRGVANVCVVFKCLTIPLSSRSSRLVCSSEINKSQFFSSYSVSSFGETFPKLFGGVVP